MLIIAIIVGILAAGAGLWGFALGVVAFAFIARALFAVLFPLFIILLLIALL
jgi:hypothetical protein